MWNCIKCGSTVDDSFEVCWKCGTSRSGVEDPSFVPADETPPIADPIYDEIVPEPAIKDAWSEIHGDPGDEVVSCYQAASLPEAKFLADQLVEQGIPAMCDTLDLQDALGIWSGNPRVYCLARDLDRARAFLAQYDANQRAHGEAERRREE
jgi:hypothetical protein